MRTLCLTILVVSTRQRDLRNSERCSLFLLVLLIGLFTLTGCTGEPPLRQSVFSGPVMGTEYRISLVHTESVDLTLLEQACVAAMQAVNQSMSTYLEDSEVSVFNRRPADDSQEISADFKSVIEEALEIAAMSNGAFDITLGKAVNLWGFGPDGQITVRPTAKMLLELRESIGYDKLSLEQNQLRKSHELLKLDLSAIAKGYAVDKVADTLLSHGVDRFLVSIGGELRSSGTAVDGSLWRVGIEKPHILGGIQDVALLDNQSIATSGDYRNYLVINGEQFSHTISPETLSPVYHRLALVSVISDRASTADALATAMMVMGEERALSFADEHNLAAYMVVREAGADQYRISVTENFKANLQ